MTIEITSSHTADVSGLGVRRALPRIGRRTVGAWCFIDHMGPASVPAGEAFDVAPHPHIGLQTVTWLIDGEALHRDSLGSEQLIRPGQLNLMTAGHGIAHSEEHLGAGGETVHGVQFWVAQPEATRHGPPAFEHHPELPRIELAGATATVLVGDHGGHRSPARIDWPIVGLELVTNSERGVVQLRSDFEHAAVVLDGAVSIDGSILEPGHLGYLGLDRAELAFDAQGPSRVLLIGGVPFESPISMFWNFVARTHDEIDLAVAQWNDDDHERFGPVASDLERIPSPRPPWSP